MEQWDVQLIRLMNSSGTSVMNREQLSSWIRRSTARDFRIAADQIETEQAKVMWLLLRLRLNVMNMFD